jgi:hypothetical protein
MHFFNVREKNAAATPPPWRSLIQQIELNRSSESLTHALAKIDLLSQLKTIFEI